MEKSLIQLCVACLSVVEAYFDFSAACSSALNSKAVQKACTAASASKAAADSAAQETAQVLITAWMKGQPDTAANPTSASE